jgi:hypothetical protein
VTRSLDRPAPSSTAVVARVDPADPYRPIIRRFQCDGHTLEESAIELRSQSGLEIISLAGKKVEGLMPCEAQAA